MKETYKSVSYCAYQRRRQTERQRLLWLLLWQSKFLFWNGKIIN
jgi:hypothetical protein